MVPGWEGDGAPVAGSGGGLGRVVVAGGGTTGVLYVDDGVPPPGGVAVDVGLGACVQVSDGPFPLLLGWSAVFFDDGVVDVAVGVVEVDVAVGVLFVFFAVLQAKVSKRLSPLLKPRANTQP